MYLFVNGIIGTVLSDLLWSLVIILTSSLVATMVISHYFFFIFSYALLSFLLFSFASFFSSLNHTPQTSPFLHPSPSSFSFSSSFSSSLSLFFFFCFFHKTVISLHFFSGTFSILLSFFSFYFPFPDLIFPPSFFEHLNKKSGSKSYHSACYCFRWNFQTQSSDYRIRRRFLISYLWLCSC